MIGTRNLSISLLVLSALAVGTFGTAWFDVNAQNAQDTCIPRLLWPEPDQMLSQREVAGSKVETRWRFSWSGCAGASRYHLYVIGPNALSPIVDIGTLRTTSHEERSIHYGVTARKGWKWRVRAFVNGAWSDWSETRLFSVSEVVPLKHTCSISGRVSGPPGLRFNVRSDRGDPVSFRLTHIFLKTPREPQRIRRARITGNNFAFDDLTAGEEYRVYPANFRSDPREAVIRCRPGVTHEVRFVLTGPPPYE